MATESSIKKKKDGYYRITHYYTSHTGIVDVKVEDNQEIEAGDRLYTITRLGLIKKRLAEEDGVIKNINKSIEGKFCGYHREVLTLEHKLTVEEVQNLEEERDYVFVYAPQGAQYYITPNPGLPPLVNVGDVVNKEDVMSIAMVMKKRREIVYNGKRGKIAKIYFINGQQCKEGDKLFGILLRPI